MNKLNMKSQNTVLTTKKQKYQHYLQMKLINTNFLQGEEIFSSEKLMEQANFRYSPLGKAFEKQIKTTEDQKIKQAEALKALKPEQNQELESAKELFSKKKKNNEINK